MMRALLDSAGWFVIVLLRVSAEAAVVVGLVLLAQWLFRDRLPPRWRHALWLLVVARLALPWSVPSPFSAFNLLPAGLSFVSDRALRPTVSAPEPASPSAPSAGAGGDGTVAGVARDDWRDWLAGIWLAGVLVLPLGLLSSTWRLRRAIRRQRALTDAGVLELLEDCKQEMNVYTPLVLIETDAVAGPSLYGFLRPRLLLPRGLIRHFSLPELRHVFLHELAHVKRRDIALNWLTTLLLALYWFNPLVWLAFSRMQADRELACDALALEHGGDHEKQPYGHTIIRLLESFGRPARTPGGVGILENRNQMKARISMIAKFKKTNGWSAPGAALFIGLALVSLTDAQSGPGAAPAGPQPGAAPPTAGAPAGERPEIIATSPQVGATDVDPALGEITVTFDRDMRGGFSWTGGGPEFPPSPAGQRAHWRDKRTCVLPVKLQAGHYYRVGINSTSFQNFRSATGVPASPSAIYFATRGASEQLKRQVDKPQIIRLAPKNGTRDVDPQLSEIRVTFSVPMGGGFSWTGGGPEFPTIPEGKRPYWTEDHKTCVLPVQLEPGHTYRLGLNSPSHKNFQSAGGVPLDPVNYTFTTRGK